MITDFKEYEGLQVCIELLLCSVQLQCPRQLAASLLATIHVGTTIWFHHLLNFKIRVHGETVNIEKKNATCLRKRWQCSIKALNSIFKIQITAISMHLEKL